MMETTNHPSAVFVKKDINKKVARCLIATTQFATTSSKTLADLFLFCFLFLLHLALSSSDAWAGGRQQGAVLYLKIVRVRARFHSGRLWVYGRFGHFDSHHLSRAQGRRDAHRHMGFTGGNTSRNAVQRPRRRRGRGRSGVEEEREIRRGGKKPQINIRAQIIWKAGWKKKTREKKKKTTVL